MGAVIQKFMNKFEEFKSLPSGESFKIEVTDQEATAAAKEYLAENKAQIKDLLKEKTGFGLDVDKPAIAFGKDQIALSAKGGMGFVKANASLVADVHWDGKLSVVVQSVDVPIISVSPEKLNSVAGAPLQQAMEKVEEYAEIRSFELTDGLAVLEAVKK